MNRLYTAVLFTIFCFIAIPSKAMASKDESSEIFSAINKERDSQRIPKVIRSQLLDSAAKLKLQDMIVNDYFDHVSPGGRKATYFLQSVGYNFEIEGENLARGFATPSSTMKAWMESPTHRANIMDTRFTEAGIAFGYSSDDQPKSLYVIILARPYGTNEAVFSSGEILGDMRKGGDSNGLYSGKTPFIIAIGFIVILIITDTILVERIHEENKDPLHIHHSG